MYKVVVTMRSTKYYTVHNGHQIAVFEGRPYDLTYTVLVEAHSPWVAMGRAEESAVKTHPDATIWDMKTEFVSEFDEVIK